MPLDAIRALRLGFGLPEPSPSGEATPQPGHDRLRWLCKTLWARNDDERRLIDRIFDAMPPPTADELDAVETRLDRIQRRRQPWWRRLLAAFAAHTAARADKTAALAAPRAGDEPRVAVSFEPPAESGGIPLPSLVLLADGAETFIMQPQTVVARRVLATLWRRFRALQRVGEKTEIDIDATIAKRSRQGVLAAPVMRARRRNRARLLILADVSTSMAPWRPFLDLLESSLTLGRLQQAAIYYFSNTPRRLVFGRSDLTRPERLEALFDRYRGAGLLVISDAGAARGWASPRRAGDTLAFIAIARAAMAASAVVWINPMPRERWRGTTAALVAQRREAVFLPLDGASLMRAIDVLRGAKTR